MRILRDGDLSAGEIAERFPLAKSTLSGHFAILKQAGLIVAERRGTTILYSLSIGAVEEVAAAILGLLGKGNHDQPGEPDTVVPASDPLKTGGK